MSSPSNVRQSTGHVASADTSDKRLGQRALILPGMPRSNRRVIEHAAVQNGIRLRIEFHAPIAGDRDRIAAVQPSPQCEVRPRETAFDDAGRLSGPQRRSDHVDGGQVDVMMLAEQRAPGACREDNSVRCFRLDSRYLRPLDGAQWITVSK